MRVYHCAECRKHPALDAKYWKLGRRINLRQSMRRAAKERDQEDGS